MTTLWVLTRLLTGQAVFVAARGKIESKGKESMPRQARLDSGLAKFMRRLLIGYGMS
jgi:hypothetical protein